MCLYTKYIENPKYKPNKKNGYNPPVLKDLRLKYVPTKCGRCIECRKEKKRNWLIRLSEEIRNDKNALFITLTFNNISLERLQRECFGKTTKEMTHAQEDEVCKRAVRLFLELIRKHTGKSVKHWLITEKGEDFNRIHLHGLIWCDKKLIKHWKHGYWFIGAYVNEKTINYITKYVLKEPEHDKTFVGKIFASAGIGKDYFKRSDVHRNKYVPGDTDETYLTRQGMKIPLPQYYKDKIYTDEEKEKLWIEKQEKGYRYVCGEKVSTENTEEWDNLITYYQERAKKLYKENPDEWEKEKEKRKLEKMKLAREKQRAEARRLRERDKSRKS